MLLIDTGVFVAAADQDDRHHASCVMLLEAHPGPLVTTTLVVAETGWLIRRQLDMVAEATFYRAIASNEVSTVTMTNSDWTRIAGLLATYEDISLDAADASLVAVAERLDQRVIATLDERDFRIVRPAHVEAFDLLPEHI